MRHLLPGLVLLVGVTMAGCRPGLDDWSDEERAQLARLHLGALGPAPADPSNAFADDPRAAALGHQLFFDDGLSRHGTVSCSSCHLPELFFADDMPRSHGLEETQRNAPSFVGGAYAHWFFWDGRADSAWAQALGPMEHPGEHGATRLLVAWRVADTHAKQYEAVFGALPTLDGLPRSAGPLGDDSERAAWEAIEETRRKDITRVFVNVGKALAAYERTVSPGPSRFDAYAEAVLAGAPRQTTEKLLDENEVRGLRLFIGEADCVTCHDGPLFTNHGFESIGIPAEEGRVPDRGRAQGVLDLLDSPFTCYSEWSDAKPEDCVELAHVKSTGDELIGAMKVPSLRNVSETGPWMHSGQFDTLAGVIAHYDEAPEPVLGHSDLKPLALDELEAKALEAFLLTLKGDLVAPSGFLEKPVSP